MSEPTRAEVETLIKRAESQRQRIQEITVHLQMLLARITRLERRRTAKRALTKRKVPK